jgi:hypothetical protein
MQYATLRLSKKTDHGDYFDFKFKLLENTFVPKWIDRVLEAQQNQYPISEPWAIYNLNDSMDETFIKNNLNRLMREVDSVEELFGIQIESLNDQDTLNKIHSIFEKHHGKLDEWKNNPLFKDKPDHFRKNLSEINQFVHACEDSNGPKKIRVVWFDLPKTKTFSDEDYKLFTNQRSFGSLYHLYADVGKNIESLAEDNDDHHHDVVPNLHYSADCVVFFGGRDEKTVEEIEKKQQDFVIRNQDYLASKGYQVDDPRLTTGKIELARLETDLTQDELLSELKNFNHIQSFFLS